MYVYSGLDWYIVSSTHAMLVPLKVPWHDTCTVLYEIVLFYLIVSFENSIMDTYIPVGKIEPSLNPFPAKPSRTHPAPAHQWAKSLRLDSRIPGGRWRILLCASALTPPKTPTSRHSTLLWCRRGRPTTRGSTWRTGWRRIWWGLRRSFKFLFYLIHDLHSLMCLMRSVNPAHRLPHVCYASKVI